FARAAAAIGHEISTVMVKLQKLTRLAKKKSLFDDRPVEINELIYIIKQDIAKVNRQISGLSTYLANQRGAGKIKNRQVEEHSTNVITSLQSKLATTSNEFKNILEVRTQNMKDQKSRRDQYSFSQPSSLSSSPIMSGGGPPGMATSSSANGIPMMKGASSSSGPGGASVVPVAGSAMLPIIPSNLNPNSVIAAAANALSQNMTSQGFPVGGPNQQHQPSSQFPGAPGSASSLFTPSASSLYNPERSFSSPGVMADAGLRNRGATAGTGDVVLDFGGDGGGGSGGMQQQQQQQLMYPGQQGANMEYIESRAQAIESIESTIAELGQIYQHFAQILAGQREMIQRIDDNVQDVEMNVTGAHDHNWMKLHHTHIKMETVVVIVKPDGYPHIKEIHNILKNGGFRTIQSRHLHLTLEQAQQFYLDCRSDIDLEANVEHLASGPCLIMILARFNAIDELKSLVGPSDLETCRNFFPNCIRARFATDTIRNAIESSDSEELANAEIRAFFPDYIIEKDKVEEKSREFLEEALYPLLTHGLTELCKAKPANPSAWLGKWLIDNNPNHPKVLDADEEPTAV
ncbi:hypothetical protein HDU76_002575, partial [Blyttiomyces sp. JEL0837]